MRPVARLLMAAILAAWVAPAPAAPKLHFEEKHLVTVQVWPLAEGDDVERVSLEIPESSTMTARLSLSWPDADHPSRVRLRVSRRPDPGGEGWHIRLDSELSTHDGRVVRSTRRLRLIDSTTVLFEVARLDDRPLTLAVVANVTTEFVPTTMASVGDPVQFHIEVQYLTGERAASLETNRLSTFVGDAVSYSFRLETPGGTESVELTLTPVQLLDDVVRVEIDATAIMPGEKGEPVLLSRVEQWMMSRGTSSTISLARGTPPTGYQFVVTPRF